jgi:hypothetical protein
MTHSLQWLKHRLLDGKPPQSRELAGPERSTPTAADMAQTVPIRGIKPSHTTKILKHLRALGPEDRYLRFGYAASDEQIEKYVKSLDFERDSLFGIYNRRLDLIAMAHLSY